MTEQKGKIAIVTGGHSGLGLETTRVLSKASATVIVGARDVEKAKVNVAQMRNVEVILLDLASPGSIDRFAGEFLTTNRALDIVRQIRTPPEPRCRRTGTRSRSWFTIEECPSPSTYRLFTPASWPRCGARSRRARLARRGGRPWARSGSSFAASQACGLMATTFFSTTTRHSRARRYCATSVSRSRAHLKLRARCTRPKRQGARLPSPSTAARTIA
jgi:hypothetical protein